MHCWRLHELELECALPASQQSLDRQAHARRTAAKQLQDIIHKRAKHGFGEASTKVKLAKFSAKFVANFRQSLERDFRASFAGATTKLHHEVLGCGGP